MFGDGKLNDPFMMELFANAEKENTQGTLSSSKVVHHCERATQP
jgi:hypothetical protein